MKSLTAFLPHSPAFDSCFPLLERIHQRGKIAVRAIVGNRLSRIEPRLQAALETSKIPYCRQNAARMELLCFRDVLKSTALITHSDPFAYGAGKIRLRDWLTTRLEKPLIFVQHGMVQAGLHHAGWKKQWKFYGKQMLLWKPLPPEASDFISEMDGHRWDVVGLIKANRLAVSPLSGQLRQQFSGYRQRVLICHNYGFEKSLYPAEAQAKMIRAWDRVIAARSDTLFIIRSHRGRKHPAFQSQIGQLCERHRNLILSDRHQGLMRMSTIHDVLCVVDRVLTHPSTVVLDAIYDDRPVAVFDSNDRQLASLYQADDEEGIHNFLDDDRAADKSQELRKLYGNVDENLTRAASVVEEAVSQL
jgi:hypothetical protein